MGFVEDLLQKNGNKIIILDDFNFESDGNSAGFKQCIDIFSNHSILNCNNLC